MLCYIMLCEYMLWYVNISFRTTWRFFKSEVDKHRLITPIKGGLKSSKDFFSECIFWSQGEHAYYWFGQVVRLYTFAGFWPNFHKTAFEPIAPSWRWAMLGTKTKTTNAWFFKSSRRFELGNTNWCNKTWFGLEEFVFCTFDPWVVQKPFHHL